MAQYDGSIRINTEINSKNASSQLMALENRIVKTADKISALKSKMELQANTKEATQEYRDLEKELDLAVKEMQKMLAQDSKLSTIEEKIQKLSQAAAGYADKMKAVAAQKIPTQEYTDIQKQIETTEKKINDLIARQEKFLATGGKESSSAYKRMQYDLEELQGSLPYLKSEIQDLIDSGKAFTLGIDTEQYKNLSAEYEQTITELENQKNIHSEIVQKQAESVEKVAEIKAQMQQLADEGRAFKDGTETEEYSALQQQLEYLEGDYSTLTQRRNEFVQRHDIQPDGYERLGAAVQELQGSIMRVMHPIESMKISFSYAMENMKERAAGAAASIINVIAHPFQAMKNIASSAISSTSKLLSGMASVAKKAGASIKAIASKLLSIGKSSKSASGGISSMGMGFKNLLKYGLGIRSLYALISKFRTAVKEGFGNLAKYSEPVNNALSSLKSSLTQLKNSLATAFAPILTAVAPALTTLINMVSKAVTYVGMLIAALTGQKTFTKATKVQQGYADSLGDTSKAAKDANKQLSSLDKLNNLTTNDSDGGGGSGGDAGAGDMFETVDIPSKISDLAKMIKEAWENADFTEIGALIGTKLRDALNNIPWDKIQATAAKAGKSLATLINGFVEVEGLGYAIGNAIAQAINTALIGLESFAANLHWDSVGKFIAEGINGALINIDWETALSAASLFGTGIADLLNNALTPTVFANIGYTIGMGLNTALTLANDFIERFEWHNFGANIGNGLSIAIKTVDWGLLGKAAGNLVSGLFRTLKSFIDKTDWKSLGKGITTAISSFLGKIDWRTVGGTISSFAVGIYNFLTGLFQGIDWSSLPENIIQGIKDFFTNFDYAGVFSAFGEHIGTTIAAGIDLLAALGEVLSGAWDDVVEYFSSYIEESGGNIILGLYNGIIAAINDIGDWIYENVFSPFMEGFKSAFGIHSPSTVMQEQGNFIMEGLLNGIAEMIDSVIEKFTEIKDKILEKWEEIKTNAAEKWEEIKTDLSEKWDSLKENASEKFSDIKQKISEKWQEVSQNTKEKWEGIKKNVSEKWEDLKKNARESAKNIKEKVIEAWEGLKSKTKEIWNGIKSVIKSPINAIIGFINKMISGIVSGINGMINALNALSFTVPDWVPEIGGSSFGLNLSTITAPKIPALATGAVIPPNREFLAVLGDQKHGTNIEAPLSTIEQAVENVLNRSGSGVIGGAKEVTVKIPVEIDGRVLFELIKKLDFEQFDRTGRPSFQI